MDQEQKITEYIKQKYNPKAIILHGSRARGFNRSNSDWDMYVFVDNTIEGGSENHEGENLDIAIMYLPLEEYDFIDTFGTTLKGAKILYDTDNIAVNLIAEAENIYGKGRILSERDVLNRKNRGARLLERIKGTVTKPELQLYHLGAFYESVIRYWYELKGEWQQPPYVALDEIQSRDPKFYNLLLIMATDNNCNDKANAADKVYQSLFPN